MSSADFSSFHSRAYQAVQVEIDRAGFLARRFGRFVKVLLRHARQQPAGVFSDLASDVLDMIIERVIAAEPGDALCTARLSRCA